MSQAPAPAFKIKLKTAKTDGDQANAPTSSTLDNQKSIETSLEPSQNAPREDSIQNAALTSKPSGVIKLKVKQSSGSLPLIGSQPPSNKRPLPTAPQSAPKKPKLAKQQFKQSSGGAAPRLPKQPKPPSQLQSTGPPKLKLKLGSFANIVSSGSGAAPSTNPPQTATAYRPHPPHPRPHLHHRHPGPKKRGRGRPPNIGGRPPRRPEDEVKYHIANLPPRSFSLRHTSSHAALNSDDDEDIVVTNDMTLRSAVGGGGGDSALQSPVSGSIAMSSRRAMDDGSALSPGVVGGGGAAASPVVLEPFGVSNNGDDGGNSSSSVPAKQEDLVKLLNRIWDKDIDKVFREPVTDSVAPGYSSIITNPMDLSTIKSKLDQNTYTSWDDIAKDLELMFDNALKYNPQGDAVWRYAYRLRNQASTMVKNAKAGKTVGGRTASATAKRKENAAAKAADRAKRDAARAAARAEQRAAQEAKVLKRAGVSADEEETARVTYRDAAKAPHMLVWGGLAGGSSADGVPLGWGSRILRPTTPSPNVSTYAASILRFAGKLKGKAQEMVMAAVNAVRSASVEVGPMPVVVKKESSQQQQHLQDGVFRVGSGGAGQQQQQQQQQRTGKRGRPRGSGNSNAANAASNKTTATVASGTALPMTSAILPPPLALSTGIPMNQSMPLGLNVGGSSMMFMGGSSGNVLTGMNNNNALGDGMPPGQSQGQQKKGK